MNAIEVINVTKRFKGPTYLINLLCQFNKRKELKKNAITVLYDIAFSVKRGWIFDIIGGAGKSTLLKLIAGIMSPIRDKIVVNGNLTLLLELGSGFHLDLTGRETY